MNEPIDKALDDYLSGNSQVSQRYRELDDAAVPPQLDQLVLARARAAVADQPSSQKDELERLRQRRKRLVRWSVPAGLAASAVLVVSIVMESGVQHEVVSMPQQSVTPAPILISPEEPIDAAPRRREIEKAETTAESARARRQNSPVAIVPDLAKESAPAPAPPPPTPSPANVPSVSAVRIPEEISADIQRRTAMRAVRSTTEVTPGTQQPAEAKANETESRAAPQAEYGLSEITVAGSHVPLNTPAAGSGPRGTVPRAAKSQPDTTQSQIHEEPQQWLERIRQLRKDGKTRDADREWKRFRKAYPDYEVAQTDAARGKGKEADSR